VFSLDKVEDNVQQESAVGNWRQSPETRKAKKMSEDAATNVDHGATT